jgi:hypothetical protein
MALGDSDELADMIVFVLFLGTFGLAIGGLVSDESVREDSMMFDLVLGSLGLAMGRSESEVSV